MPKRKSKTPIAKTIRRSKRNTKRIGVIEDHLDTGWSKFDIKFRSYKQIWCLVNETRFYQHDLRNRTKVFSATDTKTDNQLCYLPHFPHHDEATNTYPQTAWFDTVNDTVPVSMPGGHYSFVGKNNSSHGGTLKAYILEPKDSHDDDFITMFKNGIADEVKHPNTAWHRTYNGDTTTEANGNLFQKHHSVGKHKTAPDDLWEDRVFPHLHITDHAATMKQWKIKKKFSTYLVPGS